MTFGEKFKAEREKRNLTQQQVADGLGLNRRMITRYEHGVSFPRSRKAYKKIADFFEVDVNYMLTEDREYIALPEGKFDSHAIVQAQDLINNMSDLFFGGTLSDSDKDAVMKALQNIYWESRARSMEKNMSEKKGKKDDKSDL